MSDGIENDTLKEELREALRAAIYSPRQRLNFRHLNTLLQHPNMQPETGGLPHYPKISISSNELFRIWKLLKDHTCVDAQRYNLNSQDFKFTLNERGIVLRGLVAEINNAIAAGTPLKEIFPPPETPPIIIPPLDPAIWEKVETRINASSKPGAPTLASFSSVLNWPALQPEGNGLRYEAGRRQTFGEGGLATFTFIYQQGLLEEMQLKRSGKTPQYRLSPQGLALRDHVNTLIEPAVATADAPAPEAPAYVAVPVVDDAPPPEPPAPPPVVKQEEAPKNKPVERVARELFILKKLALTPIKLCAGDFMDRASISIGSHNLTIPLQTPDEMETTLLTLESRELIADDDGQLQITEEGREYLAKQEKKYGEVTLERSKQKKSIGRHGDSGNSGELPGF
ncbi:MAG: hypothetical protein SFX19_04355 [Alphaproteobacteria bacterium]|nr:hypothetical protein [Alphaproteobacteria bacterium]